MKFCGEVIALPITRLLFLKFFIHREFNTKCFPHGISINTNSYSEFMFFAQTVPFFSFWIVAVVVFVDVDFVVVLHIFVFFFGYRTFF